ncbi:hypothetical protein BO78DRAFT_446160 [Aspergillus sclerotiicarbonarius CBS 121057]|uniref:Alcohol acetyltransferase n=1 Tax=Aspergillus sclerotiicarbonarius (strain CBS 121057 / IBT 28362) TaxID=1448318 RepID=A0A319F5W8_ASPSB|nr:hypothetical protein BO78DRAFT_446160 [Aspergillus sclerotiicarbonarius CBS 121057]
MSWTQESGYWRRPLDCHDQFFQLIGNAAKPLGREHWLSLGFIQLTFSPTTCIIPRLHAAWKAMRVRYPDIAAELHPTEKRYHPLQSPSDLQTWCNLTFHIPNDIHSAEELSQQLRIGPPHMTCHWIPTTHQLVFISTHWRIDGHGFALFLDQFLHELESPTPLPTTFDGSEASNLIPSLDIVLNNTPDPKPNPIRSHHAHAHALLTSYLDGQPSIGLPIPPERLTSPPGRSLRASLLIPTQLTAILLTACRTQGITLTTALHASAIMHTVQANPTSSATRYISWMAVSLRKYCPPPFNGPLHAISARVMGVPINVNARASWRELVSSIQGLYGVDWKKEILDEGIRGPFVEGSMEMFRAELEADGTGDGATEPNFNSIGGLDGVIKKQYGDVGIGDVGIIVQQVSKQVYLHAWGWRGEVCLSASFNEAYYTREEVDRWLRGVKETLVRNLLAGGGGGGRL